VAGSGFIRCNRMKKKVAAKVKSLSPKSNKTNQVKRSAARKSAAPPPPPRRPSLMDDPRFAQAVQNYEAGLKAMQTRKYDRAKSFLEKVAAGPSKELADRAALHLNTCQQQLARNETNAFKSTEEHYDYAI